MKNRPNLKCNFSVTATVHMVHQFFNEFSKWANCLEFQVMKAKFLLKTTVNSWFIQVPCSVLTQIDYGSQTGLDAMLCKHMDKATSKVLPGPRSTPWNRTHDTKPAERIWASSMEKRLPGLTHHTGTLLSPCLSF